MMCLARGFPHLGSPNSTIHMYVWFFIWSQSRYPKVRKTIFPNQIFLDSRLSWLEVKLFYGMMLGENNVKQHRVSIYKDAWGVRKLISHALRNLRNDRVPRVSKLHSDALPILRLIINVWHDGISILRCPFTLSVWGYRKNLCLGPRCSQSVPSLYSSMVSWIPWVVGRIYWDGVGGGARPPICQFSGPIVTILIHIVD
jgi:hypothetical protein